MSNILLISQENAQFGLADFLESQGHLLEKAPFLDGSLTERYLEELLGFIKGIQPDLILLDAAAAKPSTMEHPFRLLKNDPETEGIPCVVYFGLDGQTKEEWGEWLDAGADHILDIAHAEDTARRNLLLILRLRQSLKQAEILAQQMTEMNSELYERNCQVEKELYVARQLQQSLLPAPLDEPEKSSEPAYSEEDLLNNPELAQSSLMKFTKCHFRNEQLRITGIYLPCDALGGDLYDVIQFKDQSLGIAVADVSGHGVPAGFITAIFKASLYRMTLTYHCPSDILYHLNNELASIVKTGDYVTGIYCRMLNNGRHIEYSGAGHPYPILYRAATGTLERLTENGTPLVWIPDMDYPVGRLDLEPGDKLFLFTDGISEVSNHTGEILGEEALEQIFLKAIAERKEGEEILDRMMVSVSDFTEGHPLQDDMSLVLIETA